MKPDFKKFLQKLNKFRPAEKAKPLSPDIAPAASSPTPESESPEKSAVTEPAATVPEPMLVSAEPTAEEIKETLATASVLSSPPPVVPVAETETEEETHKAVIAPVAALETYPVNAPYAYITLEASNPPRYVVSEVAITAGEQALLKELKTRLYEVINAPFSNIEESTAYLRKEVEQMLKDYRIKLEPDSKERIMYYVARDLTGYGKLDAILRDPYVEDISADGPNIFIYVYHRQHGSLQSNVMFDKEELDALIYKLAQRSGRHISLAKPLLDASLPSKDRLQLSIGEEITTRGSTFTIRRFRATPFTPLDLVNYGTISVEMAAYFWLAVENGFNILFSGGTASGKTSILNAMSMFIPCNSKIVSLEDTREINLLHQNWIPGVTRESTAGHSIEMFDLLRSALRQRPEYLLVGEVRGREAYTLFQAMATGHFTLSTVHADSVEAVVRRLTKPPIDVPLMLLDSLNLIVLLGMVKVGEKRHRRVTSVQEIVEIDFENEALKTNEVFHWKPDEFSFSGESKLFERIMNKLNITEEQLSAEYTHRLEILKFLRDKKINNFKTLCEVFFECNANPKDIDRKLREGVFR